VLGNRYAEMGNFFIKESLFTSTRNSLPPKGSLQAILASLH